VSSPTIPANSACFLEVAVNALWHLVVDYETDVWLVYAHAECDGCDNNLKSPTHPTCLYYLLLRISNLGVVKRTVDTQI